MYADWKHTKPLYEQIWGIENAVNNAFCYNELTSFIYLFDNQNTTTMTMFVQKQFEKIQAAFAS